MPKVAIGIKLLQLSHCSNVKIDPYPLCKFLVFNYSHVLIYFLFLAPKPEMIISPENVTVLPNQSFNMNCLALSFGLLKYDWSKRDGILSQTAVQPCVHNILLDPLSEQATSVYNLAVYNVQPSDEGWYCCVATNEAGSTVDCAWLEVNSKLNYYSYHLA